jgi:hypothetical protein
MATENSAASRHPSPSTSARSLHGVGEERGHEGGAVRQRGRRDVREGLGDVGLGM